MSKLVGKYILLVSPEPWTHIFVSKHHYAINLAKRGNKVYFLNPPSTEVSVSRTLYADVFSVNYKGFPPGLRFYPKIIQKYFLRRTLKSLEVLCGKKFDVIWSFDNSVFFDFSPFPKNLLKISHIVDLNQDFQTESAAKTADICFGVSTEIVNRLTQFNRKSHFINHGCNIFFNKEERIDLPGENSIKALYAGNLDIPYIDWVTFEAVIRENREVDFILVGPWIGKEIKKRFTSFPNVYHVGRVRSEALPNYYCAADLLLLLYKSEEFPEQLSNSHKMMDYLAAGKVIVASNTQEYTNLVNKELIIMAQKKCEYSSFFGACVNNIMFWNSEEKCRARMCFAEENTYDSQLDRIELFFEKDWL